MLPLLAAGEHVRDPCRWVAGCVDHDLGRRVRDRPHRILDDCGGTVARCGIHRSGIVLGRLPADPGERCAGAIGREVGDGQDVDSGGTASLRQVHGAEFARADEHDADRPPASLAVL